MTLTEQLPETTGPDDLYDAFARWVGEQGISLYPAQEEALIEVMTGSNVILSTPTGSGKSLVATGAHFAALANGQRTFYTAPIKALVSEKFFALCDVFGADKVGMLTGDASVNAGRADHLLHGRGARERRAARGLGRRRRPGGDGRVPLLLRARPRLGLAGAAAGTAERPVRPDVRDPRRRRAVQDRPVPADRPPDRDRRVGRTPGAAGLQVRHHRRCTRRSRSSWPPIRPPCTSSTSPRPPPWNAPRR